MIVSEIAQIAGVAPHVVRYYARIGLLAPARNPANAYQTFSRTDIARIGLIRAAQQLGLTLDEIRLLLADGARGTAFCCARTQTKLRRRLEEIRGKIAELEALASRVQDALPRWDGAAGCGAGDGRTFCPLIEARTVARAARSAPAARVAYSARRPAERGTGL